MLHFSIHVFRNILAANCRIRIEDESETADTMCIGLNSNSLQVSLLSKGDLQNTVGFSAPEGFFIPTSLSGVSAGTSIKFSETSDAELLTNISSNTTHRKRAFESSFRFQITNNEVLRSVESKINDDINSLNKLFVVDEVKSIPLDLKKIIRMLIKPQTTYEMQCTGCNVPVGDVVFNSIKDHCEESFSEGWFCHQSDDLCVNNNLSLDCLYVDDTSFLVSESILRHKSCSCGSLLCIDGPEPKGFVRVYFDKIYFKNSLFPSSHMSAIGENTFAAGEYTSEAGEHTSAVGEHTSAVGEHMSAPRTSVVGEHMSASHTSAVGEHMSAPCTSVVGEHMSASHTSEAGEHTSAVGEHMSASHTSAVGESYRRWMAVRTLWGLMEKSRTTSLFMKMLIQSKPSNGKEDTCLLLMIPREKVSRYHLQTPKIPNTATIRTEPVYHVQYQFGTHASKDVKTWRHAFDVDFYRVSDVVMNIVIELLRDSAFEDGTVETGFVYGYLPACEI